MEKLKTDPKIVWRREYQRRRYHTDPVYRKKIIEANSKHIRKKELTDPEFKKKRLAWNKKSQANIRRKKAVQMRTHKMVS